MFYSHQLLARKAPLGQIWMAATTHGKINRRGLDKLNIIKICEEILNPSVPMALRLSGILMGGIVIVYERKVKLLYDDVTRLLLELNSAWKVKTVMDPTVLPKGKSQAKREAITLPEKKELNVEDVEQSLQFSNAATTMEFQRSAYFTMRLDSVDEPYICNGAGEQDPSQHLHQADAENITLDETYQSFQAYADPYYGFERFDIEGEEEMQVNFGQDTQIPTTLIPSPPSQVDPTGVDIIRDQQPGCDVIQPSDQIVKAARQGRQGLRTRKRKQPETNAMDYEQTIIPVSLYQSWLQDTSDIVSRGRKRKRSEILSKAKIANLMELPPVVLNEGLFKNGNRDVHYPLPILELWYRSTQPPQDSPSERISVLPPPEPSFSSPGLHHEDFIGTHLEDFHNGRDSQLASAEKQRDNVLDNGIFIDELKTNLDNGSRAPENTPQVTPRNSGDSVDYFPRSASEHGFSSNSDLLIERSKKKRISSSRNSSGGLEPVAENANFRLSRLSDSGLTPDLELIVEMGRTQTQVNLNNPIDIMTDSIRTHIKAHFDAPGAPQVESLDILAFGMTRKSAALLFYQTCVLASQDALKVEQNEPYGEILISRGSKM